MKYRVYASEGAPPGWGVQAIVYEDPAVGWTMASGGDYYIQREGRWVPVDFSGMIDYVVNELSAVMVGRTISNQEFKQILEIAFEDRDFARKVGFLPGERRV